MDFVFTVCDRPDYLEQALASWRRVRGVERHRFHFQVEPTLATPANVALIEQFGQDVLAPVSWQVNPTLLGVHLNPYVAFIHGFGAADYVVLCEDDVVVSEDIVEYHEWASAAYVHDTELAAVCSYVHDGTGPFDHVLRTPAFAPLIWGTWRDRWDEYVGREWDKDGSTYNGTPGNNVGWDWNLNTRVCPRLGKKFLLPLMSRADHIGVVGTHSREGDAFTHARVFEPAVQPQRYCEPVGVY